MGGDNSPNKTIEGIKLFLEKNKSNNDFVINVFGKEAILKQATTPELRAIAIKEGFQTMQDMGRRMIANGDLNFREFERVLSAS